MAFSSPDHDVWVTTVIDTFSPASPHRAIDPPIAIEARQVNQLLTFCSPGAKEPAPVLYPADALAGEFDDLAVGGDGLAGEDAAAMDPGASDAQAKCSVARVNAGTRGAPGCHGCRV